jgi:hypothetical protein
MAKYVLVEFKDDIEADAFAGTMVSASHATIRVAAIFKKPTLFCECETPSEKSVRGAKWGWWLCKNAGCGKPKSGNFQQPRNLVEAEGTRTEHRRIFINLREPL